MEIMAQENGKIRVEKSETIRRASRVIQYSEILITSFQEALDFDPTRHHNHPPSNLRIESSEYLLELQKLVVELRQLNQLLNARAIKVREPKIVATKFGKHFEAFLSSYAEALGKGTAGLTIGVAISLLYEAGVGHELIGQIRAYLKP